MTPDSNYFDIRLATDEADLKAAQRLRYRVFVEELGGDGPMVDHVNRLERDEFDPVVDHLVLVDRRRDPVEALRGQAADLGLFDLLGGEGA